jgi:hypothetical protein
MNDEPLRDPLGVHPGPGRGTLLLVDISGYTAFLRAVADAHAEDLAAGTFVPEAYPLLTSLLDGIVERVVPPFELSEVEGDAVFAFAPDHDLELRGASVLSCLTGCYEAYRSRVEAARTFMVCTCDACSSIGRLELKFVLHHGGYVVQSIAGHPRVLGPDVTVAHLLLKNHVRDLIGPSAYVLLTAAAAAHLDVPIDRAHAIAEEYEHYPTIRGYVLTFPLPVTALRPPGG